MIVILGASGNIGRVVATTLLAQGYNVRALGRDAGRLGPLAARGAEPWVGEPDDALFLRRALAGASAAFAMIPPQPQAPRVRAAQAAIGEAIASAVAAGEVGHVVHLSSLGAELSEGTGPVLGMHDQEKRLDAIPGLHVVHLRPSYFMENLLGSVGAVRALGVLGGSLRPDLAFPLIATRDIAAVAAERLIARDFAGTSVRPLLGPADWTMTEVARVLGAAIGRPDLAYAQFPDDRAREAMIAAGMSADAAQGMIDLARSMNAGRGLVAPARDARSATPTPLERFAAEVFAPAYRGAAG
jgi:uncharacterized protein YbjT (DUF2867 family)